MERVASSQASVSCCCSPRAVILYTKSEYDGEVDLYGHVILCLAALHGHVEDDVLLAHQAVAFHPRHPAVAARRPHDFARGVVHDAAKARDERIAALWHLEPWEKA